MLGRLMLGRLMLGRLMLGRLGCRIAGHRWTPYGPPPRYADYRPHVVSCQRCHRFQFADGSALDPDQLERIRPYRAEPGESAGWTRFEPGC